MVIFVVNEEGHEIGKDILIQKARGYISFVRGENPYLFPYRIYPILFSHICLFVIWNILMFL